MDKARRLGLIAEAAQRRTVQVGVMITRDKAESMVTMLDAGWTLNAIAAHFGVDVKEVEQAITMQVKSERNQGYNQRQRNDDGNSEGT